MTDGICSVFPAIDITASMIVRRLLISGMMAGVLAGLIAALFARLLVEPAIDLAIGFEAARDAAHGAVEGPEIVSRAVQKGWGLVVAATVYGAATGGIFSLVFATLNGRVLRAGVRGGAAWLALVAFVTVTLTPALKYPPNPPAVGSHDTIDLRTAAFFAMIALSIGAASLAARLARGLRAPLGAFDAALAAIAIFILLTAITALLLPSIDEVPAGFPPNLLWTFRIGSLATQAILWASVGLLFGKLAERVLRTG